jgi:hypothetical protein
MPHRLLIAITSLLVALHTPAAPATKPSTTRPATTTATTSPTEDDKRSAEIDAVLGQAIPADVRDGKKDPTDEQKMMINMLMFVQAGASKSPDQLNKSEENRQKGRDNLAAAEKAAAELRKENASKPPAMRDAANKAAEAQVRAVKLFNELTDGPATAQATDKQIEDGLYDRVRKLPQRVRELIVATADTKYHSRRLDLLEKIDGFRHQVTTQPANSPPRRLAEQQAAAYEALLKAVDAKYEAQQQILKLTPLGQLSDSIME